MNSASLSDFESLSLRHQNGRLELLDQSRLPWEEKWIACDRPEVMEEAIHRLQIRGAPMIAHGACFMIAKLAEQGSSFDELHEWTNRLEATRPTAVNLSRALAQIRPLLESPLAVIQKAEELFREDKRLCDRMAENALPLISKGDRLLTHCNTGALATAGCGTAIGAIKKAFERDSDLHVYVGETRPLLQGARLTAWEMAKFSIPYTLICDSMAADLMRKKQINKVFVGADRITMNGDTANKIGTYSLAVLANFHSIPFYVVAPQSTLDPKTETGQDIPIEERRAEEVRGAFFPSGESLEWSPSDSPVYNPSFDVTPAELISGWILDTAVLSLDEVKKGALRHEHCVF